MKRKKRLISILTNLLLIFLIMIVFSEITQVFAEEVSYPDRPITILGMFSPGGTVDTVARLLVDGLEKRLNVPVLIAPKPGAAGALSLNVLSQSVPDGYTLCTFITSIPSLLPNFQDVPWDPIEDFTYICQYVVSFETFSVRIDSPWKSIEDVIEYARKNPGKFKWGAASPRSATTTATKAMFAHYNVETTFIPFQGGIEVMTNLLGGHIDASVVSEWTSPVEAGEIRLLAHTGTGEIPEYPEVPSYDKLGYPYYAYSGMGIVGPKGMDEKVVEILEEAFEAETYTEHFIESVRKLGLALVFKGSEELTDFMRNDVENSKKTVEELF